MVTFVSQSIEGVNLGAIYAAISSTTPEIPGLPFLAGTRVVATDGSEWIFAGAGGTIPQYNVVAIDNTFAAAVVIGGAVAATVDPAGGACIIGFYQNSTSLTSGQYAWFMITGKPTILVASAGITVPLYSLDTTGALTGATNTTSHYQISGITCAVTASGSTVSATLCVANSVSVRKPLAGS